MENYFPLYFKKNNNDIIRGLSVNQSDKSSNKPLVHVNPRKIPNRLEEHRMTLVWDLDQTLVSADGLKYEDEYDANTQLVLRPRSEEILQILKRNLDVEFIVWTAGTKSHAERVVQSFPHTKFDHIISRDTSWYSNSNPVKNLNLISNESRPLSSIILIDDRMDIGTEHPENLLVVPPYRPKETHASDDSTMLYLVNILQRAITMYCDKRSFSSYLFSPLSEKCVYNGHTYYGVKCFENKENLISRIESFRMIVPCVTTSPS